VDQDTVVCCNNVELGNMMQAGGLSPYGTMGQTANRAEWDERRGPWARIDGFKVGPGPDGGGFAFALSSFDARRGGEGGGARVVMLLGPGPEPGDLNGDGRVSFADFLILSNHFGEPGSLGDGDVNGNGFVDFPDFLILANNFGSETAMTENVPEPSTLGLFLIGGLAAIAKLRRRG